MITTDIKNKILAAIKTNRANYPSDAKHAASLGITTSVYSAVKNGQTDRVLSDANWISIARKLGVSLRGEIEWKVAKTPTFDVHHGAVGGLSVERHQRNPLRPTQYRQDLHRPALRQDTSQRHLH